jgi:hypothetical protein
MINEIATVDIINLALDQIEDGRSNDAVDTLRTYRDKVQAEIDQFDEWAKTQSDINTSMELEAEDKINVNPYTKIVKKW